MTGPGRVGDRLAIGGVLTDYCRMLDRMDLDGLAGLFMDDCEIIFGPDPGLIAHGRDALAVSMSRMWCWRRTQLEQ